MWIPYNNIWIGRNSYKTGGGETVTAPTDLVVSITKHNQLDLSFTAGTGEGHKVYISEDEVNYSLLTTLTGSTTTYEATGLDEETEYFFKVTAYSGATESTAITGSETTWSDSFKFTIDTNLIGNITKIHAIYLSGIGINCYINWGDGSSLDHFTGGASPDHTYANYGTYQIIITGIIPVISIAGYEEGIVASLDNWGNNQFTGLDSLCLGCSNMIANYADIPDMSLCTSAYSIFSDCAEFNGDVLFDISSQTDIGEYFSGCSKFNKSISALDFSNATAMFGFFKDCVIFNQSVSNIVAPLCQDYSKMFSGCSSFNQPVSNFDLSSAVWLYDMFKNCTSFKQSLAEWDISNIAPNEYGSMDGMLEGCDINETGTTTNYDATLVSWSQQSVQSGVTFHGGNSKYSDTGAAARLILTSAPNNWIITDGGHI